MITVDLRDTKLNENLEAIKQLKKLGYSDENLQKMYDEQLRIDRENAVRKMAEWIKVSERLPEPFMSVLVYMPEEVPHTTVHEGFINRRGEWYAGGFERKPDEVVAWREMPEPPEAEK